MQRSLFTALALFLTCLALAESNADVRVWTDQEEKVLKGDLRGIEVIEPKASGGRERRLPPKPKVSLPPRSKSDLPPKPEVAAPSGSKGSDDGVQTVCAPEKFTSECEYSNLKSAIRAAKPGDTIKIMPGTYRDCGIVNKNNLVVTGGGHLLGTACYRKAALVLTGANITVDGIECSGITVPDGNGACIRIEGRDPVIRNVYFHDNQEGILGGNRAGGGTVTIENSRFERNGHGDQAHSIYISHRVDQLIFRNNKVFDTKGGHDLKSRALSGLIAGNVFASTDPGDKFVNNRVIDLPFGGDYSIVGNVIENGPNAANWDVIGYAREIHYARDLARRKHRLYLKGNVFIFDRTPNVLTSNSIQVAPIAEGNTFVGMEHWTRRGKGEPAVIDAGSNRLLRDRAAAGMKPYPALPSK